jgi:hypothetical protein
MLTLIETIAREPVDLRRLGYYSSPFIGKGASFNGRAEGG